MNISVTMRVDDRVIHYTKTVEDGTGPREIADGICRHHADLRLKKTCVMFFNRPWEPLEITFVSKRTSNVVAHVALAINVGE